MSTKKFQMKVKKPFQIQMVVSSKVIDNVTSAKARLFAKEFEEHTACTPSPFCWVGVVGGWAYTQIFKKRGLTETQFLAGGCWERGGDLFQWGLQILHIK